MALNEARGRLHVCQQYSVRHQSLFVGGGGEKGFKGFRLCHDRIRPDPPKTVQHSYDPINCQVIDNKFSIVRHLYFVGDN